jgi:hypothetical protein
MASDAYEVHVEQEVLPNVKLVCAWHKEFFGVDLVMREAAPGFEGEGVSHGICKECLGIERSGIDLKINCNYPPIPTRKFDYSAIDGNTYDASYEGEDEAGHHWKSSPVGHGATPEEAVRDLLEQLA